MLLRTLGKSVLIATGFAYGVARGIHLLARVADNTSAQAATDARLSTLELAVANLGDHTRNLETQVASAVTRTELTTMLEEAFSRFHFDSEVRFEQSARSLEALREMVGQTDELLQKVLDGLDEMKDAHQTVA